MSTHNLCFEQKFEKISVLSENFQFLKAKFSIYLNRHDFKMYFSYLICIGKILSQENGFAAYTSRIKMSLNHKNPSIPWIEHFLLHCQMPENKHCRLPHVLKYSYEDGPDLKPRTQSKQMSHRGQSKVFPLAEQSLVDKEKADQPTKSILQQKGWSILANLFKNKKKVRFSSEVEIAERSSSIYDMSQRYKGPLCTSEVDVKDAENREQLELFCQEKATNIIDDVMKDVREHQCEFRKTSKGRGQQTQHQKTSGIYLRRKYIAGICVFIVQDYGYFINLNYRDYFIKLKYWDYFINLKYQDYYLLYSYKY